MPRALQKSGNALALAAAVICRRPCMGKALWSPVSGGSHLHSLREEEGAVGAGDIGPIFTSQGSCPKPEHS